MKVERTLKLIAYPNDIILINGRTICDELEDREYEATVQKIYLYSDGTPVYYLYIITKVDGERSYYRIIPVDEEVLEKGFIKFIKEKK